MSKSDKPIQVIGKKWDVHNEIAVDSWDEGTEPAFKLWPTDGEMLALLDADMFPYIVGFCQSEDKWYKAILKANSKGYSKDTDPDGFYRYLAELPECFSAIDHCDSTINEWITGADADSAILYLTEGKGNYRFDVAFSKEYKGQAARKKAKPPFFELIKWHLVDKHNAIVAETNEADDLMAIEQYQRNQMLVKEGAKQGSSEAKMFSRTVIVTKDKDLRMIPGWHSNPDLNEGERFWVDKWGELLPVYKDNKVDSLKGTGLIWFYAQMIVGDTVDNYTGIPMKGPSAALQLEECQSIKEMYQLVESMYQDKYGTEPFRHKCWTGKTITVTWEDMFVQQGRLAFMQTKKGEVWQKKHKLPSIKKWGKPK